MTLLQDLVNAVTSPVVVQNLGWLLIHSLWQCLLIAYLAMCLAKMLWRQSSSARYLMYSVLLSLMVIAPIVTMLAFPHADVLLRGTSKQVQLASAESTREVRRIGSDPDSSIPLVATNGPERVASSGISDAKPAGVPETGPIAASGSDWINALLSPWLSTIVAVWCCGVLLFSIRPIRGWMMVRRLLRVGTSPVSAPVRLALQRMCEQMRVQRRVEVLASTLAGSPIVVGCFRSVILVPASFVSSLPTAQLEALLAHELAHVRRFDYLVNLLQTLVETFFFYHPAVWWLSQRIRLEREHCCDDLVVAVLDNRTEYGRALLAVEEFRCQATTSLALSVKGGSLLARIQRLLVDDSGDDRPGSAGWVAMGIAIAGIAVTVWMLRNAHADEAEKSQATSIMARITGHVSVESIETPGEFGLESHGLKARLVALRPDVIDASPDLKALHNTFRNSDEITFGVELANVSDERLMLAGVRSGEGFAKEVQGTLRTEFFAPHWFEFEFMDSNGRPLRRTHREFHQPWQVADSASTHELAPQQSLTEVLRPGKFRAPMNFELPPGRYKVRVRYHGPDTEFRDNVRRHWPSKLILNAWPHEVVSNTIDFDIAEGRQPSGEDVSTSTPDGSRRAAENLVWGTPVNGLQAAIEYRVTGDITGDPAKSPGVPVGTPFQVIFHVKNVSDRAITFVSETGRQGDRVHVTNERGEKIDVKDVWYSGWPIDVAWKLEPGEAAQLNLLTPSLNSLDQPGRYNVRCTIRFNSRIQKDDAGNVTFPRPGDYDQEVETGVTPLILQDARAPEVAVMSTKQGGRWQVTPSVELHLDQQIFHGADVTTTAVLRWKAAGGSGARHCRIHMSADLFANRNAFAAVWETQRPVLWFVTGWAQSRPAQQEQKERTKAETLHRVDFSNPDCIVDHWYDGWPSDGSPSDECRATLDADFIIEPNGRETFRYYHTSLPGTDPPQRDSQRIHVFLDGGGRCRVSDPRSGRPPETPCTIATLTQTLDPVVLHMRSFDPIGLNGPLHIVVGATPDYPESDLREVLAACRAAGVLVPQPTDELQAMRARRHR